MPYFCKDNIQASILNGIVSVVWNLLSLVVTLNFWLIVEYQYPMGLATGIFGTLVSAILIFGAKQQNPTAILVWIVLAIIGVGLLLASVILAIHDVVILVGNIKEDYNTERLLLYCWNDSFRTYCSLNIILSGALILFQIWSIIVAKRTREEIRNNSPTTLQMSSHT